MARNKYHQILARILDTGKHRINKKGNITYLINEQLSLSPADLLEIFEGHGLAPQAPLGAAPLHERRALGGEVPRGRNKLVGLLRLDPCQLLPHLLREAAAAARPDKLGAPPVKELCAVPRRYRGREQPGAMPVARAVPDRGRGTCSVGLPAQLRREPRAVKPTYTTSTSWLRHIDFPLKSITLFLGNVHVYDNNIENTRRLLAGEDGVKFELNV